ncbi:carboxyltransferase [Amycolatopsis sp. Poz14]|uniref:carboxyltransferase n=1 Tax=Amycolatopsis sp. Poz14 TaxID=1447705 RepID=UPI001EE95505|nr:carboxyltransferase [Amycolatopsis sp. Poz14]MCG3754012.1 carboxyltransferase [Amycolatopsis sp. Poz14]
MAEIQFYDQTFRDGQQSLWGMKMRAQHILPVANDMDNAGFAGVELTGTTIHTVLVREFRENPYEGLDAVSARMPKTPLRGGMRPDTAGFTLQPDSVIDLSVSVMAAHGISSFWFFDCLFGLDRMERLSKVIGEHGAESVPTVSFALSDVHTDEYFADKVRHFASWEHVDAIMLADEAGVLTPERARTLLPAMIEAAGDVPIELHCHNTTGLAPLNYLIGIDLGLTRIHTASRPLANGPSLPSTEAMLENVTELGHTTNLDAEALARVARHVEFVGKREGYRLGVPEEYRVKTYSTQMPGGMMGTLRAQLAKHGMEHRLQEVLDEVSLVRAEFGYPVMATPFSQFIGTQSVLNVTTGTRYGIVTDEVILYAMGRFGDPPAPMDPNARDRILGTKRAAELAGWTLPQPSLHELRQQYGRNLSDEELLLRILVPGPAVDAMLAAGPLPRDYPRSDEHPLVATLREAAAATTRCVRVRASGLDIQLSR